MKKLKKRMNNDGSYVEIFRLEEFCECICAVSISWQATDNYYPPRTIL
ncbi:hypothetical protein PV797_15585 [Clostridiaceae bacterium M8S5]|nr:hypothetical protein PV797_15585 [Clostridiaceae bacterium M8S5]